MNVKSAICCIAAGLGLSFTANAYVLNTSLDCSVAVFNPSYDRCKGAYILGPSENDVTNGGSTDIVTTLLNDDALFGDDDWSFVGKMDDSGFSGVTNAFTVNGIESTSGTVTLDFSALPELETAELALSFKAAKSFSIYYWEGPISSNIINWVTDGVSVNHKGNTQELSHVSLFYRPGSTVEVSEPASAFLFAGGILSLLVIRRRFNASL